jgi:hypothetical protein
MKGVHLLASDLTFTKLHIYDPSVHYGLTEFEDVLWLLCRGRMSFPCLSFKSEPLTKSVHHGLNGI